MDAASHCFALTTLCRSISDCMRKISNSPAGRRERPCFSGKMLVVEGEPRHGTMNSNYNSLLLSAILIGTSLLILTFVTACEASAPEIYEGLCSLIGGGIGAGGAALAVYLTLSWQKEDERSQVLLGLFIEISGYLDQCLIYHWIYKAALDGDVHASEYMLPDMMRLALDLPLPVFFPSMVRNLTRLKEPSLIVLFYGLVESMRKSVKSDAPETAESGRLSAPQMRIIVLQLLIALDRGLNC